jgi:hypothetical protein
MSENGLELAVHVASAGHGADAAALTDSAAFMSTVRSLNPDAPGFVSRVAEAVRGAVAETPLSGSVVQHQHRCSRIRSPMRPNLRRR